MSLAGGWLVFCEPACVVRATTSCCLPHPPSLHPTPALVQVYKLNADLLVTQVDNAADFKYENPAWDSEEVRAPFLGLGARPAGLGPGAQAIGSGPVVLDLGGSASRAHAHRVHHLPCSSHLMRRTCPPTRRRTWCCPRARARPRWGVHGCTTWL